MRPRRTTESGESVDSHRFLSTVVSTIAPQLVAVQPAVAQDSGGNGGSGGGGNSLSDVIVQALQDFVRALFSPVRDVIETHGDAVVGTIVGTPSPNAVFAAPTNGPWPGVYDYYWETIVPLSLSLYGLSIGLVVLFESTSHLFSSYHRTKLKKRAFSGLVGILSWWWIAALSLRLTDALATFLVPALSDLTLFETLSFSGMGVLGVVIALATQLTLFVLVALIYLVRQLVLYLFVLLMPLLIVLWIPGVGPFSLVSKFMKKLAGFYVPFLFMTVPVALLFRVGDLLGTNADLAAGEIGTWISAIVVPIAAVASPFVLFWQAGALFFMADRASQHVSAQQAGQRMRGGRAHAGETAQGGRNFVRGVRNEPAVRSDGQAVLGSGDSRAHAVGKQMNRGATQLHDVLSVGGDGGSGSGRTGGGGGTDGGGHRVDGNTGGTASRPSGEDSGGGGSASSGHSTGGQESNRNDSHDNLRERARAGRDESRMDDDPPYYQ